ncbi:MAG: GYD domain-containing protein [Rhizobiales bacterium]|nr:GYD domain-containing protein [Hyphomicrobiales bacterium]
MARYIALANWTDKGIANVKESPERVNAVRTLAKNLGCELQDFYMTVGAYDMVVTIEAPDDEAMAKLALSIGRAGNVRTTTLKAFSEESFRKIIADL